MIPCKRLTLGKTHKNIGAPKEITINPPKETLIIRWAIKFLIIPNLIK